MNTPEHRHKSRILPDLVAGSGILLLAYGLWAVYPPAAWVTVGVILLVLGVTGAAR